MSRERICRWRWLPVGRCVALDKVARKTARMYGTPIYVEKDGKIVALRP